MSSLCSTTYISGEKTCARTNYVPRSSAAPLSARLNACVDNHHHNRLVFAPIHIHAPHYTQQDVQRENIFTLEKVLQDGRQVALRLLEVAQNSYRERLHQRRCALKHQQMQLGLGSGTVAHLVQVHRQQLHMLLQAADAALLVAAVVGFAGY